jgi:nucleoside-diphosphate-sugar epimerase
MPIIPKNRILITGGSGFIGTHLMESYIKDDVSLINIDIKPPIKHSHNDLWYKIDITDAESVSEIFNLFRPSHVIHLAARTDLDEKTDLLSYAANTKGVQNILQAIAKTPEVERLIVTSSMLVNQNGHNENTKNMYSATTLYGKSKILTEKITKRMKLSCIWTIIRPATIWGPYHERLKKGFFSVLSKGLYFHPGNKTCLKSYGYVENSVFQIRTILSSDPKKVNEKIFYISDPPINLRDWVGEFSIKMTGKDVRIAPLWIMRVVAKVGDLLIKSGITNFPLTTFRLNNMTTENVVNIDPIMSITGQLPFSISEGIDRTVKWLKKTSTD